MEKVARKIEMGLQEIMRVSRLVRALREVAGVDVTEQQAVDVLARVDEPETRTRALRAQRDDVFTAVISPDPMRAVPGGAGGPGGLYAPHAPPTPPTAPSGERGGSGGGVEG